MKVFVDVSLCYLKNGFLFLLSLLMPARYDKDIPFEGIAGSWTPINLSLIDPSDYDYHAVKQRMIKCGL